MVNVRGALALLATDGVTPADWFLLPGVEALSWPHSAAGLSELAACLGHDVGGVDQQRVDRQLAALERVDATVVTWFDTTYPERLRNIPSPPPLLFVRGAPSLLARAGVAIVGTRAPSASGVAFTTTLARDVAALGLSVVSGLARGIDTAAHRGALAGRGITVAVLGTGVDVVYPPENAELMDTIARDGCVVSEQSCGTPGNAYVFPRRNRIIAGLSEATVVVEGGHRSGALITARWALEQAREVFAVPGFPGDFRSAGPNQLLRDGAQVAESARDIVEGVDSLKCLVAGLRGPQADAEAARGPVDADAARVLDATARPASADEIAAASALPIARVQELLGSLEIDGHVVRDGAGRFVRAPR